MATTTIPDPATLKSWEEAFQYPLPTVRKLSVRLRQDIDEHRSRLRSLVGASYRDLLSTAERIIEMDKQIQSVESGLSDIGRRCNSSILEKRDTNYTALERSWAQQAGTEQRLRNTAQCKILGAALTVVSKLIRGGGNPLQAAKLMILARRLYSSLSEADALSAVLVQYRRMISASRNKLLSYIDRMISRKDISTEGLVEALSAYALLTTSTAKDVLKHLLAARLSQIKFMAGNRTTDFILTALSLFTSTFVSVQAVFPKRFAEALSALTRTTLLSDKHVKSVEELSLDIYGRWIADDVRTFTPWVSQEGLSAQDGRQAMSEYSTEARGILLQGLKETLVGIDSLGTTLDVRKQVMGASINIGTRMRMDGFQEQFKEFREVFLVRLEELVHDAATLLDFNPVQGYTKTTTKSLWDLAQDDIDLSSGGLHFRKAVLRQRSGRDESLDNVLAPFEAWRGRVETTWSSAEVMRATRWDEHINADLDDGEEEDVAPYQEMLSKADAVRVEKKLHASVTESITKGLQRLERAVQAGTGKPQFYLRLLRELHGQQLQLAQVIKLQDVQLLSRHDLARNLHLELTNTIANHGFDALRAAYTRQHYVPVDLWEGSPKLPMQPLPATFKFVMTIQQEMAKVGEDVWSAAAVISLKDAIQDRLQNVLALEIAVSEAHGQEEQTPAPSGETTGAAEVPADAKTDGAEEAADDSSSPKSDSPKEAADETSKDSIDTDAETAEEVNNRATGLQANGDVTAETASGDTSTRINLSLDNIQRLFDGLYLAKVFSTNTSPARLKESLNALKDRAALEANDSERIERYAAEYWKKTYLLFALLANSKRSYSR